MGIKERRTKILLMLFLLSDIDLTPVKINQTTLELFDLTLNQKTKGTFATLLKEGVISRPSESMSIESYQLTEKGFGLFVLEFPFFRFLKYQWDGKWRILSYEIPEKRRELRDKLRREVAGWGLGPWHRSFWLTPHPIIENLRLLVSQKEEEKYVQAFEADHTFGEQEVLIEKVWKKSELDKKYRELFKDWHMILSKDEEKGAKFKKVIANYVNVLKEDPGLPKELLGDNWIGLESLSIFKEIRNILLGTT